MFKYGDKVWTSMGAGTIIGVGSKTYTVRLHETGKIERFKHYEVVKL